MKVGSILLCIFVAPLLLCSCVWARTKLEIAALESERRKLKGKVEMFQRQVRASLDRASRVMFLVLLGRSRIPSCIQSSSAADIDTDGPASARFSQGKRQVVVPEPKQ